MSLNIAVCGTKSSELLMKVERHYKVKSVEAIGNIYEAAKVTYDYDNKKNVVFNGCVLDNIANVEDIHPFDEQVVLCALANLDIVYVNTTGLSPEDISKYHQFDEFYPVKIIDVMDIDTFIIE